MIQLDQIKTFISTIETKTFYNYVLGYIAACTILCGVTVFYYYRSTNKLYKTIKDINSSRETVLTILEDAARVQQQQAAVEDILSKDIDFKIGGYLIDLLADLKLKNKVIKTGEVTATDLDNKYRKTELSIQFEDMTMQELTILLQALENNPRIVTDRLEITKSKKKPKTIEVALTISTLLPRLENSSM
ncbi:MAG: hypothetical protein ABI892_06700 [Flavobacterium sp.]